MKRELIDLKNRVEKARSFLIVLPLNPNKDKVIGALMLMRSLKQLDKTVDVITEKLPQFKDAVIKDFNIIKDRITLPTKGDYMMIFEKVFKDEKSSELVKDVDLYKDGENFNIIFHLTPGAKFNPENVLTKTVDESIELIFAIGADSLKDLGRIYIENLQIFSDATIININNVLNSRKFSKIDLVDPDKKTISEVIKNVTESLNKKS